MLRFTPFYRQRFPCRRLPMQYTGARAMSTSTVFVDIGPTALDGIKRDRFATKMAEFKEVFEKPCVDSFNAIFHLKRRLGNKKAKYLANFGRKPKKLLPLRAKKIEDAMKYDIKQEELLHKKIAALRTTRINYSCMAGRTPRERKERENIFKLLNTDPNARTNALDDPDRFTTGPEPDPPSDGELGLAIAKELEIANLPIVRICLSATLTNAEMGKLHEEIRKQPPTKLPRSTKHSFLVKAWESLPESKLTLLNVDSDRPVVLKSRPHDPRPKKMPRTKITKVCSERPIGFEYTTFPGSVFDPMRTRKVVMYVKLAALELPRAIRSRLLELAGPDAYEDGKDLLTFKTQKLRTYKENRALVAERFRRLLAEAWKADLNYLPQADPQLPPHDLIEEEIKNAPMIAEKKYQDSFDSILEAAQDLSFFRLPVIPSPDQTAHQVTVLLKEMNNLSS